MYVIINLRKRKGGENVNQTEFKVAQIRAGLSIEDIAKNLGINPVTVYRKFNGESEFTLSELITLKKILGLSNSDVDRIFFNSELTETQD